MRRLWNLIAGTHPRQLAGRRGHVYALTRRNGVQTSWATAATLPLLLDGFEIEDEHTAMAEALFTFLVMLAADAVAWPGAVVGRAAGAGVGRRRAPKPGIRPAVPLSDPGSLRG